MNLVKLCIWKSIQHQHRWIQIEEGRKLNQGGSHDSALEDAYGWKFIWLTGIHWHCINKLTPYFDNFLSLISLPLNSITFCFKNIVMEISTDTLCIFPRLFCMRELWNSIPGLCLVIPIVLPFVALIEVPPNMLKFCR